MVVPHPKGREYLFVSGFRDFILTKFWCRVFSLGPGLTNWICLTDGRFYFFSLIFFNCLRSQRIILSVLQGLCYFIVGKTVLGSFSVKPILFCQLTVVVTLLVLNLNRLLLKFCQHYFYEVVS